MTWNKTFVIASLLVGLLSNAVASDDSVGNMPGDFHPDNVLINGDVATIIDWTTACVGIQAANNVRDNKEE